MERKVHWRLPLTQSMVLALLALTSAWCAGSHAFRSGAADPGSCRCVPDQWEGVLSSVEREFDMKEEKTDTMENSIRVHYDYTNRRCAMTDLTTGKKALADYKLGYKFIISDEECFKIQTNEVMHKMCLPDEAEFLGQYILGTNVPVGMWQITSPFNLTTRTTVIQENCVPISEEIYMSKGAFASLTSSVYLDVSLGIKDGGAFHVPPNCIQVQDDEEGLNRQEQKKRSYSFSGAIRHHLV